MSEQLKIPKIKKRGEKKEEYRKKGVGRMV